MTYIHVGKVELSGGRDGELKKKLQERHMQHFIWNLHRSSEVTTSLVPVTGRLPVPSAVTPTCEPLHHPSDSTLGCLSQWAAVFNFTLLFWDLSVTLLDHMSTIVLSWWRLLHLAPLSLSQRAQCQGPQSAGLKWTPWFTVYCLAKNKTSVLLVTLHYKIKA